MTNLPKNRLRALEGGVPMIGGQPRLPPGMVPMTGANGQQHALHVLDALHLMGMQVAALPDAAGEIVRIDAIIAQRGVPASADEVFALSMLLAMKTAQETIRPVLAAERQRQEALAAAESAKAPQAPEAP